MARILRLEVSPVIVIAQDPLIPSIARSNHDATSGDLIVVIELERPDLVEFEFLQLRQCLGKGIQILSRLSSNGVGPVSSNHFELTVCPSIKLMTIYGAPISFAHEASNA